MNQQFSFYRFLFILAGYSLFPFLSSAQLKWQNADAQFQPLPSSVHVYFTNEKIDTGTFIAYYLVADLKDKNLEFAADTTRNRRITPQRFYERNGNALLVVNCTFFSFETNNSLNLVINKGKILVHNWRSSRGRDADSIHYYYPNNAAIGITKNRMADVAWIKSDTLLNYVQAREASPLDTAVFAIPRGTQALDLNYPVKWKMRTAVGGGPALIHDGQIKITNNEEKMFAGKAINDKHPRTAMGYTKDGKLIILAIQGRSESSGGATLIQEAQILKDLGCTEALNLDGGGSSCLLINGKETIKPSDKEGQRPIPAAFLIKINR